MPKWFRGATMGLAISLVLAIAVIVMLVAYPVLLGECIYPGVHVQGVDVGGLTSEEAKAVLVDALPDPAAQTVELRAGDRSWQLAWSDLGRRYDYAAIVKAAHQVARKGSWLERMSTFWRVRLKGHSIEPHVIAADPVKVEAVLKDIAQSIAVPPTDARLHIAPDGVTSAPGESGRALDVEASASRVLEALGDGTATVELVVNDVPPRLAEPEPARTLANAILAQPFTLVADDPLTDYRAEFAASPDRVATWLRAVPEEISGEARMTLAMDEAAVEAWLLEIDRQLGTERELDVPEVLSLTLSVLNVGEHQVKPRIYHPQGTYTVQPGDTFFDIAYEHGFPQWQLEEANPDVEPGELVIGMELTIPSIDVLFPEPLAPGKRIEISLPEQRLRAYEGEELVYDFTCSSGMTSTPTIAGQFQVLFKEPNAYAPRWSLDMPYFMAIYYEGPDFANGIHELPIAADGRRLWSGVLGWPASYGCIILDIGDAEKLYNWAPVGTLVRVAGVAPGTPAYEDEDGE